MYDPVDMPIHELMALFSHYKSDLYKAPEVVLLGKVSWSGTAERWGRGGLSPSTFSAMGILGCLKLETGAFILLKILGRFDG